MRQDEERVALVALLLRARTTWREITDAVLEAGSAREVLLERTSGADTLFPASVEAAVPEMAEARALLNDCADRGVRVHWFGEDGYPAQLREIHEMPPVLFSRGKLAGDRRAISVVGSRSASDRGREIAGNIAEALAARNVSVVSGLAAGIDSAAHTAALRAGGRTVAVLGTGVNRYYPSENRALQDSIAESGLVLSQFLPDAAPSKRSFPMRNAVMSGYAAATVVVEAGEHSGARIQARYALRHGRRVLLPADLLSNAWAREFAERPGVRVISGMDEFTAAVDDILAETELTPGELAEAAGVAW